MKNKIILIKIKLQPKFSNHCSISIITNSKQLKFTLFNNSNTIYIEYTKNFIYLVCIFIRKRKNFKH